MTRWTADGETPDLITAAGHRRAPPAQSGPNYRPPSAVHRPPSTVRRPPSVGPGRTVRTARRGRRPPQKLLVFKAIGRGSGGDGNELPHHGYTK